MSVWEFYQGQPDGTNIRFQVELDDIPAQVGARVEGRVVKVIREVVDE